MIKSYIKNLNVSVQSFFFILCKIIVPSDKVMRSKSLYTINKKVHVKRSIWNLNQPVNFFTPCPLLSFFYQCNLSIFNFRTNVVSCANCFNFPFENLTLFYKRLLHKQLPKYRSYTFLVNFEFLFVCWINF